MSEQLTVAEFDARVRAMQQVREWLPEPLCGPVAGAIEDFAKVRPLVEEAEGKRRIEAAGFKYTDNFGCNPAKPIGLCKFVGDPWQDFTTWPEAAAWAESQAAKREPTFDEKLAALGAKFIHNAICGHGGRVFCEDDSTLGFCKCESGDDWQEQGLAFAAAHRKPSPEPQDPEARIRELERRVAALEAAK